MSFKHLWIFTIGNTTTGTFTLHGHFTLDTVALTSKGLISAHANDGSWVAHLSIEEFEIADDVFSAEIGVTTITGTVPLPSIIPISAEIGVAVPSISAPNLFAFVGDTPPLPPTVM